MTRWGLPGLGVFGKGLPKLLSNTLLATFIGIANPIPMYPPLFDRMAALIPTTWP